MSKSTVSLLPSMAATVPGPNFWWKTRWPGLPLVLMTGYSEALATGSSRGLHVLSKPFREAELVAALRAAKRSAAHAASSNVIRLTG